MRKSLFFLFLLNCCVCIAQQSKPKVPGKIHALTFTTTAEQPPSIDSLFLVDKIVLSEANEETRIITWFEQAPEFPGGVQAMHSFLKKNLQWPSNVVDTGGVVYVSFTVKPDGSIVEPGIAKGINTKFDAEAIQVIKLMPNWVYPENPDKTQLLGMRCSLQIRFSRK